MDNPLINHSELPRFDAIKPAHVEPAIDYLLDNNKKSIAQLTASAAQHNWNNSVKILEDLEDTLNRAWSPVSHLHSVADNDDLRKAYNNCLPKLSAYATELGQNKSLFNLFKDLKESSAYEGFQPAQKKIIQNALRDFRLSGIDLPEEKQQQYKLLQQELSSLQTKFEENLLDATNAFKKHIVDESELSGLPESAVALARQTAEREGEEGWVFTLDFPSYFPVMTYSDNAPLREELYTAYVTRASDVGPDSDKWDNSQVMLDILEKRYELAKLLGFESYAHRSLATKMANDPNEVIQFLTELAKYSKPIAEAEYSELQQFADQEFGVKQLAAWDIAYYSEKLKQQKFAFSQEDLRPYFPVPQVISGLFTVVEKLYGLSIHEVKNVRVWHKDVQFFEIKDHNGDVRGQFYLDLYARPSKRGGAWMDECVVRRKTEAGIQNPVAYLTCNFTPPIGDDPSLLTHDEVTTLFHEFGHGLHHMLTKVEFAGVSGINGVAWDAVELPSQFMENWCWEREALDLFAKHWQTSEPLPQHLLDKMLAAKNFQSGMQMVRQLEFALFDFRLHLEFQPESEFDIQRLLNDVRENVAVIKPPEFNRFQHSFSHIFAGGYAAGYYSYKWAEVLSADAFSKFEEKGIFNPETGAEFLHNILEQGGSFEPMELFVRFRGRKPSIEPLLRHSGIK